MLHVEKSLHDYWSDELNTKYGWKLYMTWIFYSQGKIILVKLINV